MPDGTSSPMSFTTRTRPLVLVVEDDPTWRNLVEILLRKRGFDVVALPSPEGAVDLATACSPDACLFDFDMPIATGISVARSVRARLLTMPIVLMTNRPLNDDLRREAQRAGCYVVLDKAEAVQTLRLQLLHAIACNCLVARDGELIAHFTVPAARRPLSHDLPCDLARTQLTGFPLRSFVRVCAGAGSCIRPID